MEQNASGVAISCPNCGHHFNIETALTTQFRSELQEELIAERAKLLEQLEKKEASLRERELALELKKQRENEMFLQKLEREKQLMKSQLKLQFQQDFDEVLQQKNKELKDVEQQLLALKQAEIENARLKRTLSQQQQELELAFETKLTERLRNMENQISERERNRIEMTLREKEKQLEDQRKLIEELRRKSEQGSGQLQGEVQEMAIESWLIHNFPLDTIEEVRKGARGADCLQHVRTREHRHCGTIYYESKRTKEFQPAWIEKFKADMRRKSADVGVLVTQAMPKDLDRMGMINGVWVCTYEEFKGLSHVLRDMVVKLRQAVDAQENKGEKMELVYAYLTSNEFKMYVEAIVEGFTQMQEDLLREKNAMTRIWNQREKQIQKVLENTSSMFGAIKGLAGASVPNIDLLQLPGSED
ncbi:MAG: DUF2130 domain-containing protein [Saprospiraceae bacterium]|nr:DUF2130 domain-containing protein [Saprospiraceae bacterium]